MITLDRLRYFNEVAKLEHVGRAAKSLHISASSISDAIKALEEELNCKLFDRINNKIKLNDNGAILLEKSQEILLETENLKNSILSTTRQLSGNFSVAASPYLMKNYLLDACLEIQKENPNTNFTFISEETSESISKLIKGNIDLALIFKSLDYKGITGDSIYKGNFEIVVNTTNPILKSKKSNRIKELNKRPAITFKPNSTFNYLENHPAFKEHGINPRHNYFYNNNDSSIALVKKTNGWALLPDIIVKNQKNDLKKVNLDNWKAPYSIDLIYRKENNPSYLHKLLLEKLNSKL